MSKCSCWHQIDPYPYDSKIDGVCYGTREREYCQCHGDQSKCDFYPPKGSGQMDTLDMMKQAKIDGKTYQSGITVLYNSASGFMDLTGHSLSVADMPAAYLNDVFTWAWTPVRTLTKEQAEQRLGAKIVG